MLAQLVCVAASNAEREQWCRVRITAGTGFLFSSILDSFMFHYIHIK